MKILSHFIHSDFLGSLLLILKSEVSCKLNKDG